MSNGLMPIRKEHKEIKCCGCGKKGVHFANCPNCQGDISGKIGKLIEKRLFQGDKAMEQKELLILTTFGLLVAIFGIWSFTCFHGDNFGVGVASLGPFFASVYALISFGRKFGVTLR